jgi:hypothetical protein
MPRARIERSIHGLPALPFDREENEEDRQELDMLEWGSDLFENVNPVAHLDAPAARNADDSNLVWSNMRRITDPKTGNKRSECLCCGKIFAGGFTRAKYVVFLNRKFLKANHSCVCSSHLMGTGDGVSGCEKAPEELRMKLRQQQAKKMKSASILVKRKAIADIRLDVGPGAKNMTALADACEALAEELEAEEDHVQPKKKAKSEPLKVTSKQRALDELAQAVDKETLDTKVR